MNISDFYCGKRLTSLLLSVVVLGGILWPVHGADNRRREEQKQEQLLREAGKQLQFYRQKLEDVKVQRWQDKRNSVASQEAFQKMWDELKRDVDQLNQTKLRKEEMLLRLQGQKAERQEELNAAQDRDRQFRYTIQENVDEFEEQLAGYFPYRVQQRADALQRVKTELENDQVPLGSPLGAILDLHLRILAEARTSGVSRERLPIQGLAAFEEENPGVRLPENSQAKMLAGHVVRLGYVYQGFVSTESKDVAMLVKTGKLGDRAWQWVENVPPEVRASMLTMGRNLMDDKRDTTMLVPMDVQLKNAMGDGFLAEDEQKLLTTIRKEYRAGGWAMHLILAAMILGLLLSLEKAIRLSYHDLFVGGRIKKVLKAMKEGNRVEAREQSRKLRGANGDLFRSITENAHLGREEAEGHAYSSLLRQTPALERNLSILNVLAAAAPLLGLLGTVSGMINLFTAITVHGTDDPRYMADGIAEALVTTKWGLLAAVPILLLYAWLNDWAMRIIANMEKNGATAINLLFSGKPRPMETGLEEVHAESVTQELS